MGRYRRREERDCGKGAKSKPKMRRRTPVPPATDAFVRPPSREMLMSGGRPVSTLSRGGV